MKAKHKSLKQVRLSGLDGVRDVALGHMASADRQAANYAKSEHAQRHDEKSSFDDVVARQKRYGVW